MLSRYVPQMYAFTVELSTDALMQQKLDKLIGVWEGHKYFNDQCFKQLRNPSQIYSSAKAVQAAEYAKLAADIEVNLQAMYAGYEQQHKNYVQHIMQQIAQIDVQIEAEKDRARGAIPSLLSGMTREPPPLPGPGPGPGPGIGARRSRFDQQPGPMPSKSQEDYGQFFAPPPRVPPKQTWVKEEKIPDGDDIDGHPFNEEDLIPSVRFIFMRYGHLAKYYELPAGIMIPLIEIEQFSYNAIVPDKLRMPPPVPPSQRLLSALDEFYSASLDPTREPPLAAWGRGGCTEFMERKQSLKKILEEKLKSENKTIGDLVENKPTEEELKIVQDDINAEIKRKYEEMRRNALANEEKEKRESKSPQSPSKRKSRARSRGDASRFRMPAPPLSGANKGAQLMQKMGWSGAGLGASKQGIIEPIGGGEVRDRQDQYRGLGSSLDPYEQYRRQQYVGCPHKVHFDSWGKSDRLLMSTRESVFASLSANTGQIVWRRIQEDAKGLLLPMEVDDKAIFTISDSGRVVRVWNKRNGALLWQKSLGDNVETSVNPIITLTSQLVLAANSKGIYCFSKGGEAKWNVGLHNIQWLKMSVINDVVHVLSISDGVFTVRDISLSTGEAHPSKSLTVKSRSGEKCVIARNYLACIHSESLFWVDFTSSVLTIVEKSIGCTSRSISVLNENFVLVRCSTSAIVFGVSSNNFDEKLVIHHRVDAATINANSLVAISGSTVEVYDTSSMKQIFKGDLPSSGGSYAPVEEVYLSSKDVLEMLTVGADCRTEFIVIDAAKSSIASEWVREEGLARIGTAEMVDLPLSELQQMIEDEFDEGGSTHLMSSFFRRLVSQASQMQKWLLKTVNQMFSFAYMLTTRTDSFSKLLDHVRSAAKTSNHRGEILERDFFNLRKMLVVVSLDGVIYGLDSSDGSIAWRYWLGENFSPLLNSIGVSEVPLFIHRSTAHYQLPGLASVVFKDSVSSAGVVIFFNPITGEVTEKAHLTTAIKRVDVLSFAGKDHINPLLVIDQHNQINIYPPQPDEILSAAPPVYIFDVESSQISGSKIDLMGKELVKTWSANLHLTPSEHIIIVKGKPRNQKVHSQGRVLIDRNVQYKYANPNLAAIAALDSVHQYLSIFLVDVVSGQMVHSARLAKATAPVHLVHCEHWIAYSYWSEKGRRTEIGVLELYEGNEQSNKDRFDSLAPTKQPPEVVSQSFIYAQGIQAMGVSETEKGLTTRSLLLALPLGGIHEVTRKLLDATRPLELTQEMREEMMIPYMPEIAVATEDMVNYNQTVHGVRGIKTAASGLESTSLMLAYGKDIFFTRLTPSGTFDILKDDFDHVLISTVLFGLIAGSIISKKLARNNALSAAWS
ncbi:g-patch domain protein [Oesophagostomum dentatum]|uniref:ER membrane protein complex subunit 1 n=1 Tax=Oesophagostomum dentatum TaxID=61180 RepID=A0A0B1TLB1_OESDE|nr:g-patch domain protein [Oesophagostomum dentatum]